MPLCVPLTKMTGQRFDELLSLGYRRSGSFFYRTRCPRCQACEPLRIEVAQFKPSRSQRRTKKKCDVDLQVKLGTPVVDRQRIDLFNRHRSQRQLDHGNPPVNESDYRGFLLNSPVNTLELSVWWQDQLIAISITDVGDESLSAVYCFFEPERSHYGLGTYAILQQIDWAQQWNLRHLYLGLYVAENGHLNYKANFVPHERLVAGTWQAF